MSWPPHLTVATVVRRHDRFLVVEESIDGERVINQPAGHLEPDESLFDAARRETLEETGWEIELTGIVGIYHYHAPGPGITYHRTAFSATAIRQTGADIDEEIIAAKWMTRAELARANLRSPLVLKAIDDFEAREPAPLSFLWDRQ